MGDHRSVRLVGNGICLAVQSVNAAYMLYTLRGDLLNNRQVYDMQRQQYIYFTIWNVIFQIAYLIANIICEAQEMYKINDWGLLKPVKACKQILFDAIAFPSVFMILLVFWPLFIYDRELLYPAFIDRAVGALPNYIMHAFILPVVLWEMRFTPTKLSSRIWSLTILGLAFIFYNIAIAYNYYTKGLWPYPIAYSLYGTVYLPLAIVFCFFLGLLGYLVQWPLRRLVHINDEIKTIKHKLNKAL